MEVLEGGCHCGAVRFEIITQNTPAMLDCNCSICRLSGYLHLFVAHNNFTLLQGEHDLVSYRFGSGLAEHIFCKICGVKSFYQPKSHPESYSVHYKALDEGHMLKPVITKFDGRNWEAAHKKL